MLDDFYASNSSPLSWTSDVRPSWGGPSPYQITYVSAPCGSGKTHNLADLFAETLRTADFDGPAHLLYAAPSNDLIDEFSERLTKLGVTDQRTITSKHSGSNVVTQVIAHLKDPAVHRSNNILRCEYPRCGEMDAPASDPHYPRSRGVPLPALLMLPLATLREGF